LETWKLSGLKNVEILFSGETCMRKKLRKYYHIMYDLIFVD